MGSRIQLDPTLTDAQLLAFGISSYYLPVAHALQRYGCFIVDSSGWMTLYAETWNNAGKVVWPSGWYPGSANLMSHFRRVAAPQDPVWDTKAAFGQPHR
jgi:hypothetical protein